MKVVALVSGGKDSCLNMLHCVANGHQIVALANLRPPSHSDKDELDSHLYQTVGHDAIPHYASCMNLPLYRRSITGSSLIRSPFYRVTQGDETEDLYELLKEVKEHHPDVQGVSVGAILSNYQRIRVEHVCDRLGLTSLAYLWRRDQKELLDEMIELGLEAVLIKVAAIGLEPSHLGKSIRDMRSSLIELNEKYGINVCGEGGEYETLTVDCPLFVKRLIIADTETVTHSDDAFATVAYLRLKKVLVQDKPPNRVDVESIIKRPSWQNSIEHILASASSVHIQDPKPSTVPVIDNDIKDQSNRDMAVASRSRSPFHFISGVTAYDNNMVVNGCTIEEETRSCMNNIKGYLDKLDLSFADIVSMNVVISDMNDFGRVNAVYKTYFDIKPATRACVAVNLPHPVRIQVDLVAIKNVSPEERETMHVQSLSYWAPANVGPYSQAIISQNHAFIAGQIGLIPSSLQLPPSLQSQSALSLHNLQSITTALNLNLKQRVLLCLCYVDEEKSIGAVKRMWEYFCNEDNGDSNLRPSPVLYLVVPVIPKNGKVEWHATVDDGKDTGVAGCKDVVDVAPGVKATVATRVIGSTLSSVVRIATNKSEIQMSLIVESIVNSLSNIISAYEKINPSCGWNNLLSARIFYKESVFKENKSQLQRGLDTALKSKTELDTIPAISYVPVISIDNDGSILGIAIHGV
ncbi:1334_t:CDS:10 [Paraglomus brasilianum]|uniref:Diphthine--ammonia ligase n=1 Tax=Paraglomus brasilianum TaxID=144538 RepID=A0A9N9C0E0_9GLOM|nr:1334_t:CDS:10 [Paraglomus brasilianum]